MIQPNHNTVTLALIDEIRLKYPRADLKQYHDDIISIVGDKGLILIICDYTISQFKIELTRHLRNGADMDYIEYNDPGAMTKLFSVIDSILT